MTELPLSPMQKGLLLDTLRTGQRGMGIEQLVVAMPEAVDERRLSSAFTHVLERHETLRCKFRWHGNLSQVVQQNVTLPFTVVDDAEIDTWLSADREPGFPLDSAPLLRVTLLRNGPLDHHLVFTFHHILLDGRSILQVVREAFQEYDGGFGDDLPKEIAPFSLHVRHLESLPEDRSDEFFAELLDGFPGPTALPFGVSAAGAGKEHRERSRVLSPARSAEVASCATELGARSSTLVHAAWALLLGRHAESNDVTFGGVRACRHSTVPGAESMVGVLMNTLPIRVRLTEEQTVRQLVSALREGWVALRDHENTPLAHIRGLAAAADHSRLFDTLVMYEQYDLTKALPALGGPWVRRRVRLIEHTGVPLSLSVYDHDGMRLTLEYDVACFDDDAIDAILDQLDALLLGLVEGPDRPIVELTGLSDEAHARIMTLGTGPALEGPMFDTAHGAIWDAAERSPNAIAISSAEGSVTLDYATLKQRARGFAALLRQRGVARGDRVGLCVGREVELAVGILGILEAGAAYVPLDPSYPEERLRLIVEDASLSFVACTHRTRSVLAPLGVEMVPIGDELGLVAEDSGDVVGPDDIAYVIYTSGSTGRPKGVPIRHRSVVHHALATRALYGLGPLDRVPQFASISFDIAVEEMFPTWSVGAELVLRPDDVIDVEDFTRWLAAREVTVLQLPTAYFERWVDGLLSRKIAFPEAVRLVVVGGEAATHSAYLRFTSVAGPDVRWINAYGPTEATVTATTFEAGRGVVLKDSPPIGRPIPGTIAHVLDQRGRLAPLGVPGELHLGGECLSLGYLGRPEANAERFIQNPLAHPGEPQIVYRTGDRVRMLPTGDLTFLGRNDRQVKVRGYRIELAEVEAALTAHPEVTSAAVKVWGQGVDARLVGYVSGTPTPDAVEVRRWLEGTVPGYLVPARIVPLDALPSLPNGKVDYASLPAPSTDATSPGLHVDRPRTLVEHMVLEVWRDTLGRDDIGINDNFFAIGGDSLGAIRMLDQTNRMGLEIDGPAFFHSPTIAGMAGSASVPKALLGDDARALVTLQPRGTRPPLYFMHSTPGDLLGYGPLIYALGEDQPCYGLQSRGLGDRGEAHLTIEAMAQHYTELIRRFQPDGPYVLVGWCFGGHIAIEMARLLSESGGAVAPVVIVDAYPALGPVGSAMSYLRRGATLIRRGPRQWLAVGRTRMLRERRPDNPEEVFLVDVDAGAFSNRRAVYDHNLAALDAYRSRHYPASILLIRCTEPTDTVMEPDYGWSRFVEGVETFELDATHGTLLANPHARDVAGFLAKWVDDLSLSRRRVDENDLVAVDVAAHGLRRGRRQTA